MGKGKRYPHLLNINVQVLPDTTYELGALSSLLGFLDSLEHCVSMIDILEDFIQAQKYIVYIFKVSVHNLLRHCDGSFVQWFCSIFMPVGRPATNSNSQRLMFLDFHKINKTCTNRKFPFTLAILAEAQSDHRRHHQGYLLSCHPT